MLFVLVHLHIPFEINVVKLLHVIKVRVLHRGSSGINGFLTITFLQKTGITFVFVF